MMKFPTVSKLILFDWIRKSKTGNFFYVSTGGIQVFLIDENSLTVKKGSGIQAPVINAWYDGVKQFLAVLFLDTPTDLKIYDFNKLDEGINFKAPAHQISLKMNDMGCSLPAFNTNSYYERSQKTVESNSSVVIDFINLYKECFILHIDSESGTLALHDIATGQVKTVKTLAESKRN